MTDNCIWTDEDTAICERAKASGVAIDPNTGKDMTLEQIRVVATEFDKVRNTHQ